MKRTIGKLLVSGVLTSGVAVATAGPSSAVPHDWCMDSTHYWNQMAVYWTAADQRWSDMLAWESPDQSLSTESGGVTYTAHTSQGDYQVVGWNAWQNNIVWAHHLWENAANIAIGFYNNTTVCA